MHGEGPIARVQQQIEQPRVAAIDVIVQKIVSPQPCGFRQMPHDAFRDIQSRGGRLTRRSQQAKRILQHVHASAAMRRIHHQPEAATARQHRQQRAQSFRWIGQMMQHATAIDVVERTKSGAGQVQQRALLPDDVGQPSHGSTCLSDLQRRSGTVQPGHAARTTLARHMLGQHDGRVASATAGDQGAQGL